MSDPTIIYSPRLDIAPEAELSALASVYRFILDCHAKKEAAPTSSPDAAKGFQNDRDRISIPQAN
jgi:hypothetical protein